jgi:hypothetical protein
LNVHSSGCELGQVVVRKDLEDLEHSLEFGDTLAATASFLCRDVVSEKMNELGLAEQTDRRKVARKRKVSR